MYRGRRGGLWHDLAYRVGEHRAHLPNAILGELVDQSVKDDGVHLVVT